MSGTRIGGVTIAVGAEIRNMIRGVDKAKGLLGDFQRSVNKIRLAGAVKGDPFSQTRNYMKTAGTALDKVFDRWAEKIQSVTTKFDKMPGTMEYLAVKSRKATESIIKSFEKADAKFNKAVMGGKKD